MNVAPCNNSMAFSYRGGNEYATQRFEPSEAELRAAAMGALESPDAANGALAMDTDNHGKAAKKLKSRGGKLAARLSPEEVRWRICGSTCDVRQGLNQLSVRMNQFVLASHAVESTQAHVTGSSQLACVYTGDCKAWCMAAAAGSGAGRETRGLSGGSANRAAQGSDPGSHRSAPGRARRRRDGLRQDNAGACKCGISFCLACTMVHRGAVWVAVDVSNICLCLKACFAHVCRCRSMFWRRPGAAAAPRASCASSPAASRPCPWRSVSPRQGAFAVVSSTEYSLCQVCLPCSLR